MAASRKRAAKKSKFGEKAQFVRSMPASTPAKEVVAAAKKKGISLSENYIYNLRSNDGVTKKRGAKPGVKRGASRKAGAAAGNLEAQLRRTVAELGLAKAREIFLSVESAFRS
jgi:hypothetical protein